MKLFLKSASRVSILKLVIVSILALLLLPIQPVFAVVPGNNELVSRDSSGNQGNNASSGSSQGQGPSLDKTGRYIVFNSAATNLVLGDTNSQQDIFLRDRVLGTTTRVNVSSSGTQANNMSSSERISNNGRYIAFMSWANNLVVGDTNSSIDIFVHDRDTGITELVSKDSSGTIGNGPSSGKLDISADGRFVVFASNATNLVPGDSNGFKDIFIRDRNLGTTSRLSVSSGGMQANWESEFPSISCDGAYVVFNTSASSLTSGDTNNKRDTFLVDRSAGHAIYNITAIGNDDSTDPPSISCDGSTIAFSSMASNLVQGDTNTYNDIFAYNITTGTIEERLSVSSSGSEHNGGVDTYKLSGDGRYLVFESGATNLVLEDTNGVEDVFLRDRATGTTERVSIRSSSQQTTGFSRFPQISADGKYIVFVSSDAGLVVNDTNGAHDIFVSETGIIIDNTAPVVTGSPDRLANANGWYNADVTIDWIATDPAPSWGTPTDPPNTVAGIEGNNVTYTSAPSCDPDNNCATGSLALSIDKTAPTITAAVTPAPNSNGWNNTDVTVTFTCSDALSAVDTCSAPATLTNEGNGHIVSGTAVDKAGNSTSVSSTVRIDKTIPTVGAISFNTSANQGIKGLNQTITVSAPANDVLSGIDGGEYFVDVDPGVGNGTPMAVSGSDITGTIGTNLTPGSHQIYVRSLDVAGNWSIVSSRQLIVLPF